MTNKITFLARLFSVLSATFLAVSCESDDICDHTVNTPRLVVRFYNANNTRTPVSIANLTIYGEGNTTPLVSSATLDSFTPETANSPHWGKGMAEYLKKLGN